MPATWHRKIDANETLKSFEAKSERGEAFVTESEICEHFLYPQGEGITWSEGDPAVREWWDQHRLSGDNILERSYPGIYPRLTTRV